MDNVVNFPESNPRSEDAKSPEKGEGVTSFKELRKLVKSIDLTKIRLRTGAWGYDNQWKDENDHSKGIRNSYFNRKYNKKTQADEFYIILQKERKDRWDRRGLPYNIYRVGFFGGKGPAYSYESGDYHFTNTRILINNDTDEITKVTYTTDNDFLNNWLRSVVDVSIENNWEDLHTIKVYEFVVHTTHNTSVVASGRTKEEARVNALNQDETLYDGQYSWRREINHNDMSVLTNELSEEVPTLFMSKNDAECYIARKKEEEEQRENS